MEAQCLYQAILDGNESSARFLLTETLGRGTDSNSIVNNLMVPAAKKQLERFASNEIFIDLLIKTGKILETCIRIIHLKCTANQIPLSLQSRINVSTNMDEFACGNDKIYMKIDFENELLQKFYIDVPFFKLPEIIKTLGSIYITSACCKVYGSEIEQDTYRFRNPYSLDIVIDGITLTDYYARQYQAERILDEYFNSAGKGQSYYIGQIRPVLCSA